MARILSHATTEGLAGVWLLPRLLGVGVVCLMVSVALACLWFKKKERLFESDGPACKNPRQLAAQPSSRPGLPVLSGGLANDVVTMTTAKFLERFQSPTPSRSSSNNTCLASTTQQKLDEHNSACPVIQRTNSPAILTTLPARQRAVDGAARANSSGVANIASRAASFHTVHSTPSKSFALLGWCFGHGSTSVPGPAPRQDTASPTATATPIQMSSSQAQQDLHDMSDHSGMQAPGHLTPGCHTPVGSSPCIDAFLAKAGVRMACGTGLQDHTPTITTPASSLRPSGSAPLSLHVRETHIRLHHADSMDISSGIGGRGDNRGLSGDQLAIEQDGEELNQLSSWIQGQSWRRASQSVIPSRASQDADLDAPDTCQTHSRRSSNCDTSQVMGLRYGHSSRHVSQPQMAAAAARLALLGSASPSSRNSIDTLTGDAGLGVGTSRCSTPLLGHEAPHTQGAHVRKNTVNHRLPANELAGSARSPTGFRGNLGPQLASLQLQRNGSVIYSRDDVQVLGIPLQQLLTLKEGAARHSSPRGISKSLDCARPPLLQGTNAMLSPVNHIYSAEEMPAASISGAISLGAPLVSAALASQHQHHLMPIHGRTTSLGSIHNLNGADDAAATNMLPVWMQETNAEDVEGGVRLLEQAMAWAAGRATDGASRHAHDLQHNDGLGGTCTSHQASLPQDMLIMCAESRAGLPTALGTMDSTTAGLLEGGLCGSVGPASDNGVWGTGSGHRTPQTSGMGRGTIHGGLMQTSSSHLGAQMRQDAEAALRIACMVNKGGQSGRLRTSFHDSQSTAIDARQTGAYERSGTPPLPHEQSPQRSQRPRMSQSIMDSKSATIRDEHAGKPAWSAAASVPTSNLQLPPMLASLEGGWPGAQTRQHGVSPGTKMVNQAQAQSRWFGLPRSTVMDNRNSQQDSSCSGGPVSKPSSTSWIQRHTSSSTWAANLTGNISGITIGEDSAPGSLALAPGVHDPSPRRGTGSSLSGSNLDGPVPVTAELLGVSCPGARGTVSGNHPSIEELLASDFDDDEEEGILEEGDDQDEDGGPVVFRYDMAMTQDKPDWRVGDKARKSALGAVACPPGKNAPLEVMPGSNSGRASVKGR